ADLRDVHHTQKPLDLYLRVCFLERLSAGSRGSGLTALQKTRRKCPITATRADAPFAHQNSPIRCLGNTPHDNGRIHVMDGSPLRADMAMHCVAWRHAPDHLRATQDAIPNGLRSPLIAARTGARLERRRENRRELLAHALIQARGESSEPSTAVN